jgi:HEAT repeat protein
MPLIRAAAALAAAPPSLAGLIEELGAREADRRRHAALALPAAAGAAGRADCLAALARQLVIEFDPGVREAVLLALVRLGGGDVADMLARLVCLEDANLRNGALDALKRLGDVAMPAVDRLLADADADVRLLSIEVLRDWPAAAAAPRLCAILERETRVNVVGVALDVAVVAGDVSLLPALAAVKVRLADEPFIGFAAAAAEAALSPAPPAAPAVPARASAGEPPKSKARPRRGRGRP